MISRICWALSLWLSQALEPSERDAAIGDLVECGESGTTALQAVLGLTLRRQAAAWEDWRMWLLFAMVLLPLSFSLSLLSQGAAQESAVYTWMYANNWDWTLAKSSGFWYVFADAATRLFLSLLAIASWSWSTGFVLGTLRRHTLQPSRTLMFLLLALFQNSRLLKTERQRRNLDWKIATASEPVGRSIGARLWSSTSGLPGAMDAKRRFRGSPSSNGNTARKV